MYLSYYKLQEKPFQISADPKFLWLGEKHKEAFAVLKYGIMDNKGFLLLTGDVGAGKTTLINALMNGMDDNIICATVPDPGLNKIELYNYIVHAFKIDKTFNNKVEFLILFNDFLDQAYKDGKKVLLIIDESQRLTQELLEEIRLLSNIEKQSAKLLNIFFVGQVEFNSILLEERNKAVRQRITVTNHVRPLSEPETDEYIKHRLKIAGRTRKLFAPSAVREIHSFSKGYPRLINIVCDIALLTGYVREATQIDKKIILESYDSLKIDAHKPESGRNVNMQRKVEADNDASDDYLTYPVVVENKGAFGRFIMITLLVGVLGFLLVSVGYLLNDSIKRDSDSLSSKGNQTAELQVKYRAASEDGKKSGVTSHAIPKPIVKETMPAQVKPLRAIDDSGAGDNDKPARDLSQENGVVDNDQKKTASEQSEVFKIATSKLVIDFSHNSNDFTDDAYGKLDSLASYLVKRPEKHVVIKGYTDSNGDYSYNKSLSVFRANIVKSYLIGKGVQVSRIVSVGMGAESPVRNNATAQGRRANRRVEIDILESDF